MSIQSKVDDWFTAGNNWRFIALVGGLALIVIVLVFGSFIKSRTNVMLAKAQMSRIAPPVTKPDTIAQVIQDTTPEPVPVESAPGQWKKSVDCVDKGCWDPDTNRWIYLGKFR